VPLGAEASFQFGSYHIPYTVICFLLYVTAYLYSMNFARSFMLHESKFISQIASYCIHFARSKSPLGLNVLFFTGRFQSDIDDILSGSYNHVDYSQYNSSIADVQLCESSFLSEFVSISDSRQSFFGHVTFIKAK